MPYLSEMIISTTLFLLLLLIPDSAFAWGAGTHLMIGMNLLSGLESLPPAVSTVIAAFPKDFLYGCIAADIIVGKKYTDYMLNCHRWNIGLKVLQSASTEPQKACAYGYLSHLAADTIAHNVYVPFKIIKSFKALTLKHAYWETRFDTAVDRGVWETGLKIAKENYQENDRLLRSVLTETIFSFGTNKKIFNSILLVSRMEQWQQAIKVLEGKSRFQIEDHDREEYLNFSMEAAVSILTDFSKSIYISADPTGETALEKAEKLRKNLRLLYNSAKITSEQAEAQGESCKSILKEALFDRNRLNVLAA